MKDERSSRLAGSRFALVYLRGLHAKRLADALIQKVLAVFLFTKRASDYEAERAPVDVSVNC